MESAPLTLDPIEPVSPIEELQAEETHSNHTSSLLPSNDEKDSQAPKVPSTKLQRSYRFLWLVLGYSFLSTLAWGITCVLVYRPITTRHYGIWLKYDDDYGDEIPSYEQYLRNERWWQVARVIQTIVAVLALPLTGALCASAAVIFAQRQNASSGFSLRKTIVLADGGWTSPELYFRLLRGQWRRYGSTLLYFAIAFNVLGAVIFPLQSVLTTTRTRQIPAFRSQLSKLADIPNFFGEIATTQTETNSQLASGRLLSAITSTSNTDSQSRLWSATGAFNCSSQSNADDNACTSGQVSLANVTQLQGPFLAELPAGFNTGLVRQFIPRINSSATRTRITEDEFPKQCDTLPTAFYVNFSTTVMTGFENGSSRPNVGPSWSLIACMPGNQTKSPWKDTRARQDFSEVLFLNLSAFNPPETEMEPAKEWSGYFKIVLDTTAGYFELPNYMNGQVPGQLLTGDPNDRCGRDCIVQGTNAAIYDHNNTQVITLDANPKNSNGSTNVPDSTMQLEFVSNKGPLLTTALALFGPGSFVAERVANPEVYISSNGGFNYYCYEMPFQSLLTPVNSFDFVNNPVAEIVCIPSYEWNFGQLQSQIIQYLQMFVGPGQNDYYDFDPSYDQRIKNGFEAAAYLANELWLTSAVEPSLTVTSDLGAGIQVPKISAAGIAVISILLAIYLSSLLGLAIYGSLNVRWTRRFDSLTMMQLGGTISEHLQLHVVGKSDHLKILDELSGSIGDATNGEGKVGDLVLGRGTPLRAGRDYRCFDYEADV